MVSIFRVIRENNVQVLNQLIGLATGEISITNYSNDYLSKQDLISLQQQLKAADLKLFDLNKRSTKGRTALHVAATWNRVEIAKLLIDCPLVDVNLQDRENGWTALHRALYMGNIEIARMLLQRHDIDIHIKDWEQLGAFDLYDMTISGAYPKERGLGDNSKKPDGADDDDIYNLSNDDDEPTGGTDVYSWGQNTNYVLGHPDSENRNRPERVQLQLDSQQNSAVNRPPYVIESVMMAKYHMAVLTSEPSHNMLVCGFGRGGRLGLGKDIDTQLVPTPVPWSERIVTAALGRDHTLAVTESGAVISFGSNAYGQLGYETEIGNKKDEAPMQLVPRKIQAQNLKKQPIIGVAASRVHSVIYTSSDLYTFGLNQGQLGYSQSNSSETCQTTPRKATLSIPTRVFMPVKIQQVIANDNATVILTETSDVYMLCNYTQQKLFFPFNTYPSNIKVYKPAVCYIVKLISSGTEYLGALTNLGHVFIWICKSTTKQSANNKNPTIVSAPQLIWATGRTRLMAVDASIGQYGEVIICTASGRVFMGRPESGKYRFSEMPYIQRCIRVCANSSGAFAAIRSEHPLQPSPPGPSTLKQDLYQSLPHVIRGRELESEIDDIKNQMKHDLADIPEEDETSRALIQQRFDEQKKAMVDQAWDDIMQRSIDDRTLDTVFIIEENKRLYCHSSVLATRSHIFKQLGRMADKQIGDFKIRLGKGKDGRIQIHIERCELVSLLLMFDYIYSDEYEHPMKVFFESPALSQDRVEDTRKIQKDLVDLAELFHLPHLLASAQSSFNHQSTPSLLHSLQMLMDYRPDVMLKTRDKHIPCHEVILRQRCVFFKHLLAPQSVWAAKRREQQKDCIEIDMEHMSSEIAETIRQHLYLDTDAPYLFEFIQRDTEDTMLQFLLELLCEADALLLERLKLIVENALIPFIKLRTATNILEHADIYCANVLKQRGLEFIKVNLSVFLPSRMLDRLPSSLIHELENLVRLSQAEVCPLATRGDFNGTDMIDATEIEDDEFSTSLYALSRGNGTLTSAYDEILVTLYPEKPVSNVETKEEQEKERDVDKRVNKSKKAVRIPLQELIEDTQANIAYNWASSPEPTTGVRPSLREILEEEHQTTDTVSKLAKSSLPKKISQKERKKLQQQLQEPSSSSSHQTNKHVWGKVAPAPVKSFVKTMEDEQQQQQQHPQQQKQKQQRDLDTKGKKIYVSEEDLLPPVRETIPTTESKELAYDPIERISSTFNLTPIRRYIKRASLQNHESTIQSFETIQKQQELEDNWSKNGQPKKNLLRIQKEEQAIVGLEQYYIQSLDVMSGEWCEIHRISQEKKSVHRNK